MASCSATFSSTETVGNGNSTARSASKMNREETVSRHTACWACSSVERHQMVIGIIFQFDTDTFFMFWSMSDCCLNSMVFLFISGHRDHIIFFFSDDRHLVVIFYRMSNLLNLRINLFDFGNWFGDVLRLWNEFFLFKLNGRNITFTLIEWNLFGVGLGNGVNIFIVISNGTGLLRNFVLVVCRMAICYLRYQIVFVWAIYFFVYDMPKTLNPIFFNFEKINQSKFKLTLTKIH